MCSLNFPLIRGDMCLGCLQDDTSNALGLYVSDINILEEQTDEGMIEVGSESRQSKQTNNFIRIERLRATSRY